MKKQQLLAFSCILCTTPLWAGTINSVTADGLNPVSIVSVADPETYLELQGVQVTFVFGTFSETALFGTNGKAQSATAILQVGIAPDTSVGGWDIATFNPSNALTQVKIVGFSAGTYFDRTLPIPGTLGSGIGQDANCSACGPADAVVNYTRPLGLLAATPLGDLYGEVDVTFVNPGGLTFNNEFLWSMDSDTVGAPGPSIPEPSAWASVAGGLFALAGLAWARRQALRIASNRRH